MLKHFPSRVFVIGVYFWQYYEQTSSGWEHEVYEEAGFFYSEEEAERYSAALDAGIRESYESYFAHKVEQKAAIEEQFIQDKAAYALSLEKVAILESHGYLSPPPSQPVRAEPVLIRSYEEWIEEYQIAHHKVIALNKGTIEKEN
jgi:hypothetical protein